MCGKDAIIGSNLRFPLPQFVECGGKIMVRRMSGRRSGAEGATMFLKVRAQIAPLILLVSAANLGFATNYTITPDTPGPGDVHFTINSTQNVKAISPWIYGMNGTSLNSAATGDRMGG